MSGLISKPLLAMLLAAGGVSALMVLKPGPTVAEAADDLLAPRHGRDATGAPNDSTMVATVARARIVPPALKNQGYAPPPPPPVVTLTPVVAKPTAPNPPFVYLGRMVQGGKYLVFLGQGDNVEVVGAGDEVGANWRLESIGDAALQLRYLPLNEMRQLLTSK